MTPTPSPPPSAAGGELHASERERGMAPAAIPLARAAQHALLRGAHDDAARVLDEALQLAPGHPELQRLLALAMQRQGRADTAIALLRAVIQVIIAQAVARLVLITAAAASAPAKYGSPPLKPFQPSQRRPAPTATNGTLLGAPVSRSRRSLGPTIAAATNPETRPPGESRSRR